MANKMVEQVCNEIRGNCDMYDSSFSVANGNDLADRIIAAHEQDVAAVSAERDEWQKQALEENAALDVARAELAAKNTFIERLKSCLAGDCERMRLGAEPCANCHIERINERNEIIKELADALDNYPCHNCKHGSDRCKWCYRMKEFDSLVAKAREETK